MHQTGSLQGSTLLLVSCAAMSQVTFLERTKISAHADQAPMLMSGEACESLWTGVAIRL